MSDRRNRRNYYRILHVQPDAPREVLKSSYRALMLSLENHPDRGGDHWDAALINEAWGVLSDPGTRAEYDRTLALTRDRGDGAKSGGATSDEARPEPAEAKHDPDEAKAEPAEAKPDPDEAKPASGETVARPGAEPDGA